MIKSLGLIPARGGSKGVFKKNIRLLGGRPLIAYTIEAALESELIDRVVVSTDDEEIGNISKNYGAEFSFLRPSNISGDITGDLPVIKHAIDWFRINENSSIEKVVYLRPTAPLRSAQMIDRCITKFEKGNFSALRTVTKVVGVHHPYWMYQANVGLLEPFVPGVDIKDYYQRQLLPECLRLNGVVDIVLGSTIDKSDLFGTRIGYLEVDEHEAIDIDSQFDFELAEFIITRKNGTR